MVKLHLYYLSFLFFFIGCDEEIEIIEAQQEQTVLCPPCEIDASKDQINSVTTPWPDFKAGDLIKINSLTQLKYEQPIGAYPNSHWNIKPWWKNRGTDPWSEYPYWGDNYVQPNANNLLSQKITNKMKLNINLNENQYDLMFEIGVS